MNQLKECNYINPSKVSLDWECFVVSKTDMELDGLPRELINSWMAQSILEPFSIRNNEINFKTKDIKDALNKQNWYYETQIAKYIQAMLILLRYKLSARLAEANIS